MTRLRALAAGPAFHYRLSCCQLLVTLPLLTGRRRTCCFFRGAGTPSECYGTSPVGRNRRDAVNKYEIARTILTRLNERGDAPSVHEASASPGDGV